MRAASISELATAAQAAAERIGNHVLGTYMIHSPRFSAETGADVYFKLENLQQTGSFKLRGATNLLLSLPDEQISRGCVAASSGNHGAGVACAASKLGLVTQIIR